MENVAALGLARETMKQKWANGAVLCWCWCQPTSRCLASCLAAWSRLVGAAALPGAPSGLVLEPGAGTVLVLGDPDAAPRRRPDCSVVWL